MHHVETLPNNIELHQMQSTRRKMKTTYEYNDFEQNALFAQANKLIMSNLKAKVS